MADLHDPQGQRWVRPGLVVLAGSGEAEGGAMVSVVEDSQYFPSPP